MLAAAAFLFAAIFVLRLIVHDIDEPITLLFGLPIAIVAFEFGVVAGLAAAAVALGLFAAWDLALADDAHPEFFDLVDYMTRGAAFFLLAMLIGGLAGRIRRVSAEATQFWELSTDLLCTAGMDGHLKRLNPAWESTLGWTMEELHSRPLIDFVHPEDRERTEVETRRLRAATGETVSFENRVRCKDGSYRTLLWGGHAVPEQRLLYAVAKDITERSQAEDALRSSERFLESVLENIPAMVFIKDARDLRFESVNRAGEELLGFSREELVGRNDHDFFPREEADFFTAKDREVLASGEIVDIPEEPIERRDGVTRLLHTMKVPILDEAGQARHLLGISEDITERLTAEREMAQLRLETEQILAAARIGIFRVDTGGRTININATASELLGGDSDAFIGRSMHELSHHTRADGSPYPSGECTIGASMRDGRVRQADDEIFWRRDGTSFPIEFTSAPISEDGRVVGALVVFSDISSRAEAAAALEQAKLDAETANRAKSEFLSRVSHELRTPLNAIIGFGQLLELEELEQRQDEGVEHILKGGRHLLELIDEVLDISGIESGRMGISIEPVHVGSVLAESLSLIGPLAQEADVSLDADPSKLEDWFVLADQQRLKQVLINLLANAVKYNRAGGEVKVSCERLAEGRVSIVVSDTGVGMSEEQLENLFSPFERLGAESSEVEGTGLGLALSKALVEVMGGTIEAESEPGVGTTMRVELESAEAPELEPPPIQPTAAPGADLQGKRRTILYVEDNLSNLKLVEQALERLPNIWLIPAMQGTLGLELARRHRPDLILLDLHLPDLDGASVLEQLKADPATAQIPVVVISADATHAQVERLRAAGAADYLTKPIDVRRLLEIAGGGS